jgi:hypothetical protein
MAMAVYEGEKWLDTRGLRDLREPSTTERCNEPTLYGLEAAGRRIKRMRIT